jgi:hypothetical protein
MAKTTPKTQPDDKPELILLQENTECNSGDDTARPETADSPSVAQIRPLIHIDPSLRVVPDMTTHEREALREDIKAHGIRQPLYVEGKSGGVVDGVERFRIIQEENIEDYPVSVLIGMSDQQLRDYARTVNATRRHLTRDQRQQMVVEQLRETPIYSNRRIAAICGCDHKTVAAHRASLEMAGDIPHFEKTEGADQRSRSTRRAVHLPRVKQAQKLLESLPNLAPDVCDFVSTSYLADDPEQLLDFCNQPEQRQKPIADRLQAGGVQNVKRVSRAVRLEEDLANFEAQPYDSRLELDSVRVADLLSLAETLDLPAESVDFCCFDPPYLEEYLPLYGAAAKLAAHVLKPGRYALFYAGNAFMPQVVELVTAHLDWQWCMVELHSQGENRAFDQHMIGKHRLVLVLRKPGPEWLTRMLPDAWWSKKEKDLDEWQQPLGAALRYVDFFSRPGEVVLDATCGTGTIPAAAKALGRKYVAFDLDEKKVKITLARLAQTEAGSGRVPLTSPARDQAGLTPSHEPNSPYIWVPRSSDLPLERAAGLPAGQLEAAFDSDSAVTISRHGMPLVRVPVQHVPLNSFVKPKGNRKLEGNAGVVGCSAESCYRGLTGFHGTHRPCFSDTNGLNGCFANCTEFARQHQNKQRGYNVAFNGAINNCAKIRLPRGEDFVLPPPYLHDPLTQPKLYRVDGESTDGSFSISLGLFQRFAEANPDYIFQTFCSNYFRPSDEKLNWLASLPNCWTIHTLSGWFQHQERGEVVTDEFESRLTAIIRFIGFGVPVAISICTRPDWNNDEVLRRALELVPPDRIIEAPYRSDNHSQEQPLLNVNPLGACGDFRVDGRKRQVQLADEDGEQTPFVLTADGDRVPPHGAVHARCYECRLQCCRDAVLASGAKAAKKTRKRSA